MKQLEPASVDMVLTDLPYGSTDNKWDHIIPIDKLWQEWSRILKPSGVVALTAIQPFSSMLVMSKLKWFRHEWIWIKNNVTAPLSSNRAPMRAHESVLIFSGSGKYIYNLQNELRYTHSNNKQHYWSRNSTIRYQKNDTSNWSTDKQYKKKMSQMYCKPRSIQSFSCERNMHPTQKPVSLFAYLIKTYTNENDVVLDCCAGSGTAGVAAIKTNRQFILIEQNPEYFQLIKQRLSSVPSVSFSE